MAIIIQILLADGKCIDHPLKARVVIGRSRKSDIVVEDSKISSRHCSLELSGENTIVFKDLESTNGSYVDMIKLSEHHLKIGEKIRIGSTYIFIDESKLTQMERLSIGRASQLKQLKDDPLTLPEVPNNKTKSSLSVVRNKNAEKAKKEREVFSTGKDRMLEQEELDDSVPELQLDKKAVKKA